MEALQPVRPPLSQQPPPRMDAESRSDNPQSMETKQNDTTAPRAIPDVDISLAYKRKSLKHRIECGVRVKMGEMEITELKSLLGARQCSMYKTDGISLCVVCDEQCINGDFAVETVLFIPNKHDAAYDHLGRFRIELPRIACYECSAEYASMNSIPPNTDTQPLASLASIWSNYKNGTLQIATQSSPSVPITSPAPVMGHLADKEDEKMINNPSKDTMSPNLPMGMDSNSANKTTMPLTEADRDPFDDGFLICTQLVKTGGADQGGLQVGDVFVEFGHYSKKRFPGLKSIANLVRRSAGKEINVVVWRKLEQMNAVEDDGSGRTVFQKLALKLKPLQSHDADGGGVLGSVINTYPLPEMKN
eukprot:216792_1